MSPASNRPSAALSETAAKDLEEVKGFEETQNVETEPQAQPSASAATQGVSTPQLQEAPSPAQPQSWQSPALKTKRKGSRSPSSSRSQAWGTYPYEALKGDLGQAGELGSLEPSGGEASGGDPYRADPYRVAPWKTSPTLKSLTLEGELPYRERLNVSTSAYRVLYILLLLVQHRSLGLNDLNLHLLDNPHIQRTYNSETITKYINTLRQVGCAIPPANRSSGFRYLLKQSPFPLPLPEEQLESLLALAVNLQQRRSPLLNPWLDLLKRLSFHLSPAHQQRVHEQLQACQGQSALPLKPLPSHKQATAPPPFNTARRSQSSGAPNHPSSPEAHPSQAGLAWQQDPLAQQFERYCQQEQVLRLQLKDSAEHPDGSVFVDPQRLEVEAEQLWLLARCRQSQRWLRLPLAEIEAVEQLPHKGDQLPKEQTVLFELRGRLGQNYRPYAGETLTRSADTKTIIVKAQVQHWYPLLERLMKYGELCVILSPKPLKEMALSRLKQQLGALSA